MSALADRLAELAARWEQAAAQLHTHGDNDGTTDEVNDECGTAYAECAAELRRILAATSLPPPPPHSTGEVYAVQRETVDGLYAFQREADRDAYMALLDRYEITGAEALTITVMTPDQASTFLANERESLAEAEEATS